MKKLLFISAVFLFACSKEQRDDCITSAGEESVTSRSLDAFSEIIANDKLIVLLVQDSIRAGEVEIRGPKNLLGQINTEVRDGILHLNNGNTCNFVRSFDIQFELTVYIDKLVKITANAAARFVSEDSLFLENISIFHNALSDLDLLLHVDNEIYINSFNSAKTILRGYAKVVKGSIEEVSSVDALELNAEEVLIDHHSPVHCYINASRIIYVKLYNSGNIYYLNEPSELKLVSYRRSTGDLLKL
jgi:hypothetical protein